MPPRGALPSLGPSAPPPPLAVAAAASATAAAAGGVGGPPSSVGQVDWARHVAPGVPMLMRELLATQDADLPTAVRIIGQLDSFDASGHVAAGAVECDSDGDASMDDASPPPSSGFGLAVLRHASHRLLVDTSLLHSPYSFGSEAAAPLLQFERHHWYQVIGDVDHAASGSVYVRARVCRELDENFDLALWEETVQLRRIALAKHAALIAHTS